MRLRSIVKTTIVAGVVAASAALAPAALACPPVWKTYSTAAFGTHEDSIFDVAVRAEDDVWSAGSSAQGGFVERWNGNAWVTRLQVPNLDYRTVAVTPTAVWVGGQSDPPSGMTEPRFRRWNGSNWNAVSSPTPGTGPIYVNDMVAIAGNDIWAVGEYETGGQWQRPLLLHWDGSGWDHVPHPSGVDGALMGVWANGANHIWAVGTDGDSLTLHYDGVDWQRAGAASPGAQTEVHGVTRSPDGSWFAAGVSYESHNPWEENPVALSLSGAPPTWQNSQPVVRQGPNDNLFDVAAFGYGNAWAAGVLKSANVQVDNRRTLVQHWNGNDWKTFATPDVPGPREGFFGISATPAGNLWAYGYRNDLKATLASRLCPVQVEDSGFSSLSETVPMGSTVPWSFPTDNAGPHTFSDDTGMLLFDVVREPGESFKYRFDAAGTYPVSSNVNGQTSRIRVPPRATRVGQSDDVKVVWSETPLESGFEADVEVRRNSGAWTPWKTGTATRQGIYSASQPGTYEFRARLVRPAASGSTSEWSPADSVVIP